MPVSALKIIFNISGHIFALYVKKVFVKTFYLKKNLFDFEDSNCIDKPK